MRAAALVLVLLLPALAGCMGDGTPETTAGDAPGATVRAPEGPGDPRQAAPFDLASCRAERWPRGIDYACLGAFNGSVEAPPRILTADWIDLAGIAQVSKFRSAAGHDYRDDVESCRSLKHYFSPQRIGAMGEPPAGDVAIRAPAAGTVMAVVPEHAAYGMQVQVAPDAVPGVLLILFHVDVVPNLTGGRHVEAGEALGRVVPGHGTDIAVFLMTPEGRRAASYFDLVTDDVFAAYAARGAVDRGTFVIPRAERDAAPLTCEGEAFVPGGYHEEDWVVLAPRSS